MELSWVKLNSKMSTRPVATKRVPKLPIAHKTVPPPPPPLPLAVKTWVPPSRVLATKTVPKIPVAEGRVLATKTVPKIPSPELPFVVKSAPNNRLAVKSAIPGVHYEEPYRSPAEVLRLNPAQPLPPPGDVRATGWLITVNTNRLVNEYNTPERLTNAIRTVINGEGREDEWEKLITQNGRDHLGQEVRLMTEQPVQTTLAAEVGEKQHRLHAHAMLVVRHHTSNWLFLNLEELKRQLEEEFGDRLYVSFHREGVDPSGGYIYVHKEDGTVIKLPRTPMNVRELHRQAMRRARN